MLGQTQKKIGEIGQIIMFLFHLMELNLQQVSNIIGSKIVQQYKNNAPQFKMAKNLRISLCTVHNIIKIFRESGELSDEDQKRIVDGCDL